MKAYYERAGVTIYHGDCLEVLASPYSLYGGSVMTWSTASTCIRRVVAAAPNFRTRARTGRRSRAKKEFGFVSLTCEVMEAVAIQVGKLASRWVLVFSDVESSHRWRDSLVDLGGLDYVRTGAWVKVGATPQFTGDRPAVGFEAITICHPSGRKRWNGGGKHALWSFPIVLNRSHEDPRLHTTQKPLSLMRTLLGSHLAITLFDFDADGTTPQVHRSAQGGSAAHRRAVYGRGRAHPRPVQRLSQDVLL